MITEDYCSFEVAKLLKEKGFNEPCMAYYTTSTHKGHEVHYDVYSPCNSDLNIIFCNMEFGSLPTHQMAMKWLRNEHNIMVSPYALSLGYYFEIFDLTTKDITGCKPLYKVGIPSKEDVLSTYEKAVEAGIKYCLENLI